MTKLMMTLSAGALALAAMTTSLAHAQSDGKSIRFYHWPAAQAPAPVDRAKPSKAAKCECSAMTGGHGADATTPPAAG